MNLTTYGSAAHVAVFGASGGIGKALCETMLSDESVDRIYALSRTPPTVENERVVAASIDITDESSIAAAAANLTSERGLDLVIVATGILHRDEIQPEKSMQELAASNLANVIQLNTIGPVMVAKHFLPLLSRQNKSAFAVLSARVGSIEDNRLGGWYAYRTSKAALNMAIKSLSIEHARRAPQSVVAALHPGTVDTALSKPFSGRTPVHKLFTAKQSAEYLLTVIDGLDPSDTGGFFAWDGSRIPW